MRLAAILMTVVLAGAAQAASDPELVEIRNGEGSLQSYLFRPAGPGPFPAVVALHGCSGLGRNGEPVARHFRAWAEQLAGAGFAVLFPDSFGSRELPPQCTIRDRQVRASRERVADAHAARHWLQSQDWVAPDHVSLMGWSNGAVTVLWTIRRRAGWNDEAPDFRSAVALYPGCNRLADIAWSARVPTLVLIGSADDWTSAEACEQMVAGARGRSARAAIVVYPGAYHDFDHPDQPVRRHDGLAFTVDGSGRAHAGTDPAARADALRRVPEWLRR